GHVLRRGVPVVAVGTAAPQQRPRAAVDVAVRCQQLAEAGRPAGRRAGGLITRMGEVQQRLADQLARKAAEDARAGVIDSDEAGLGVKDRQQASGAGEELLKGVRTQLGA
ncbi:MAG: hypothetical protein ABSE75_13815, partial [Acidimicrobiales bacterium]